MNPPPGFHSLSALFTARSKLNLCCGQGLDAASCAAQNGVTLPDSFGASSAASTSPATEATSSTVALVTSSTSAVVLVSRHIRRGYSSLCDPWKRKPTSWERNRYGLWCFPWTDWPDSVHGCSECHLRWHDWGYCCLFGPWCRCGLVVVGHVRAVVSNGYWGQRLVVWSAGERNVRRNEHG